MDVSKSESFQSRVALFALWGLLLAWGVVIGPQQAAADNIDDALLLQAPELIKNLQERGYKNVGVLTFLLQQGKGPSQFRGATICNTMAARVENALILKMSSKKPQLMIMPQASSVAAKELSGASYRSVEDRRRLFSVQYPQGWGDGPATAPDVFVIGRVKVADDRRSVVLSVAAFDREKMFDILEFEVKTDRYILADIGQGYSLAKARRRGMKIKGMTDDAILCGLDKDTKRADNSTEAGTGVADPKGSNPNPNPGDTGGNVNSGGPFPVQLTVYYDGQPQDMQPDSSAAGTNNFAIPEPQQGQDLTFGLVNTSDGPLCAVLMVNGVNTLYEQTGQPTDMNKWILEPGKTYRVKGYHQQDGTRFLAITTLSDQESKDKYEDLGGDLAAGLIHLYVFTPVSADQDSVLAYTRSIGRITRNDIDTRKFATFAERQAAVVRKSNLYPPGVKPLAGAGQELPELIEEKKFGDVRLSDVMVVRYSQFKP